MKKFLCMTALFLLLSLVVYATEYSTIAAVTQVSQRLDIGFNASAVVVINDGTNEVFVSTSLVATTSNFRLDPGEILNLSPGSLIAEIALICSPGETSTARVGAWR